MAKKAMLFILFLTFTSAAYGMSLQISVNGDPEPDEIYIGENESAVLDIWTPDGYGGSGDDVYFVLCVENAYGTISGGVVTPSAPVGSTIGPCPPDMACAAVIGPSGNGVWGAVMSVSGTPADPGVYFDEIAYQAGGGGEAVIQLYTTQDFSSVTLEDSVVIRQGECMKSSAPEYADWVAWGKPACWCLARHCRGDAEGLLVGPFWVGLIDLNILVLGFNKIDTELANEPGGICGDFDHTKVGPFRVQMLDLNIFVLYFNKIQTLVPECDKTNYNFWITP